MTAAAPTGRRFTPLERLGHTVKVFWTRTGEVIDRMPVGVDWDYSDSVSWSSLGSLTVTVPVPPPSPAGRHLRARLRTIARAGSSLSLAVVRDTDRRVMAAGWLTGAGGTDPAKFTCASLGKFFDSRILIANPYWGTPNDSRANLTFNLAPPDLLLELFRQGSTGYRRDLPLDIPAGSGAAGAESTAYKAEDLVTVYEAAKKITDRDDGPEVALTPTLLEDAGGVEWIRYRVEVGTPLLGTAAGYQPGAALAMPVWNYPSAGVELDPDVDFSEMVSTAYQPGDSVGSTERQRIIGVHVVDRGGDYLPALERADRTNASSTNVVELNQQARAYGQTNAYPMHEWAISVPGDRWPLLGTAWNRGDLCRIRVAPDAHWLIEGGEYVRRVVGWRHAASEKLTLVTSDGSEAGLDRWVP